MTDPRESATPVGIRDSANYLPKLESLRGVAILLVAMFHADATLVNGEPSVGEGVSPFGAFVHAGHTGVTLFFVLSAFLLSRSFIAEAAGGHPVSRRRFLVRRALRILPLYWVVVLASSWLFRSEYSFVQKALPHLFFFKSFSRVGLDMFPYSDVWWSLGTEAQFYLALAFSTLLWLTKWGRLLFFALVALYLSLYFWLSRDVLGFVPAYNLFGRGPAFVVGIGVAWIYLRFGAPLREALARSRLVRLGASDLLLLGLVLALGLLLRQVVFLGFVRAEFWWHSWHVVEALLWGAILLVTLLAPLRLGWLVFNRPMALVGVLSYSLYLVHFPIEVRVLHHFRQVGVGWTGESFLFVLLSLVAALAVSALTYRFIEMPVLRRKARIAD